MRDLALLASHLAKLNEPSLQAPASGHFGLRAPQAREPACREVTPEHPHGGRRVLGARTRSGERVAATLCFVRVWLGLRFPFYPLKSDSLLKAARAHIFLSVSRPVLCSARDLCPCRAYLVDCGCPLDVTNGPPARL